MRVLFSLPELAPGAAPSSAVSELSLYSVLGVGILASKSEIRAKWLKLVLVSHPDRGGCAAVFQRFQHAYEVLSDDEKRAEYDLQLLFELQVEEYLRRFVDLTLTAQGLQLVMGSVAATHC